jgi:hypothetical protein
MTPPLAVALGAAAAAAELRTLAAAIVEEPIVEEAIAAEQRIGEEPIAAAASRIAEATGIAERRFEGEHLQPALIMGAAAATATRTINIAVEAATTAAAFIPAAASIEAASIEVAPCIEVAELIVAAELIGAVAAAPMLPTAAVVAVAGAR